MTYPTTASPGPAPGVCSVRRDQVGREIRLELADWRTRTGGVYGLPTEEQRSLLVDGHLPGWGKFLPDFVIVYATGDPVVVSGADGAPVQSVVWTDLRVHVGGAQVEAVNDPDLRRGTRMSAAQDWHGLDALLGRRAPQPGAPSWLLDLIRNHTPWGPLLSAPVEAAQLS